MSKAELKRREKFAQGVMGRTIMGVTVEDGTFVLVLEDESLIMVFEDDGNIQAWHGRECDD